jgi:hypothetical protein
VRAFSRLHNANVVDFTIYLIATCARGSLMVKALGYKPEGRADSTPDEVKF